MKIIVNGVSHNTEHSYLTYEQVCEIAGAKIAHNPSMMFRARLGPDTVREGCMSAGNGVTLAEEMVFNVIVTGNS